METTPKIENPVTTLLALSQSSDTALVALPSHLIPPEKGARREAAFEKVRASITRKMSARIGVLEAEEVFAEGLCAFLTKVEKGRYVDRIIKNIDGFLFGHLYKKPLSKYFSARAKKNALEPRELSSCYDLSIEDDDAESKLIRRAENVRVRKIFKEYLVVLKSAGAWTDLVILLAGLVEGKTPIEIASSMNLSGSIVHQSRSKLNRELHHTLTLGQPIRRNNVSSQSENKKKALWYLDHLRL